MAGQNLISMLRDVLMDARQNATELGYTDDVAKVDEVLDALDGLER